MSLIASRAIIRFLPRLAAFMRRNPGLGNRLIRQGMRYGRAAAQGAGTAAGLYDAAKQYLGKRRAEGGKPAAKRMRREVRATGRNIKRALGRFARRKKDPATYQTTGGYGGRFPRPYRKSGRGLAKYNRNGMVFVKELTGTVSDPDVVYVMNNAVNTYDVISAALSATLRTLLEKAGIRITGLGDDIAPANMQTSRGEMTVRMLLMNTYSYAVTTVDAIISAGTSISTLNASFLQYWINWSSGFDNVTGSGNANNVVIPQKFILYTNEDGASSIQTQMSEVVFDECEVELYGSSELKVQNRTKSASGSADEQDISNNPLQGRLYFFKGVPKPKNNVLTASAAGQMNQFSIIPVDFGVKTLVGATDFGNNDFKEPMPPTAFWNCTSSSKIRLEPGQIKTYKISAHKMKALPFLMKVLRLQYGTSASEYSTNYSVFPVQMIALEDVINVNLTENISIAYEIERVLAVKVTTRKKKFCRSNFVQSTVTT